MNILILHRIPYHKIQYERGINHQVHNVFYLGLSEALKTIPSTLRCIKLERKGLNTLEEEAIALVESNNINLDLIISLSEYELLSAARLREYFFIEGSNIEDTLKVRNKLIMKKCVEDVGIKVPQNTSLNNFLYKNYAFQNKIVLKPVDGASSENVFIYENHLKLREDCIQAKLDIEEIRAKEWSKFEVEEFIDADIIHLDGLVYNSSIQTLLSSKYLGTCLDYAKGKPLGSYQISTTQYHLSWVEKVLQATNLKNGSFHIEAFDCNNELVFLELANRVGGADVVETYELATGIHLPSAELKIYLGEKPDIDKNLSQSTKYGWFVFPGHHYNFDYCKLESNHDFLNAPYIMKWNDNSEKKLTKHVTYHAHEVPLAGIVKSNNSEELKSIIQNIFFNITIYDNKERK